MSTLRGLWPGVVVVLAVSIMLMVVPQQAFANSEVAEKDGRFVLSAEGQPMFVRGILWRPPPSFDENPAAFWKQPKNKLDAHFAVEAPLMKKAGINALRFGVAPPVEWVDTLHDNYGLDSVLTLHAASGDLDATVDRYNKSPGLLFWVVVGEPNDDAIIESIKKRDDKHAVGLYSRKLSDLTRPGAHLRGADFFVIPSLEGAHADAFERARTHLSKPLLLWSLSAELETSSAPAAQPEQWHQVYRHAVATKNGGTSLGAFSAQWCGHGPKPAALCDYDQDDSGKLTITPGPDMAVLAKLHGFDVLADGIDTAAVDAHFSSMVVKPTPPPAPAKPDPVPPAPAPQPTKLHKPSKGNPNKVIVQNDKRGMRLLVDGRPFMVNGVNWGYIPVGENYAYDIWSKTDAFIKKALADEMPLLKAAGFNAIRQYDNIPPRWVTYIYETYGIYTMVNHLVGRYGFEVNGAFLPSTDYSNPSTRKAIKESVAAAAKRFKNVPGVLIFLLGNENNYGLSWTSSEIEDLPDDSDLDEARASHLYSLFAELIDLVHSVDKNHPVSIANGDIQYIDVVARYCKGKLDIFGTNVYRGKSVGDMFAVVKNKLNVPVMFTEFGADAYDAKEDREDHLSQAEYLKEQWREIYEQSYGHGRAANSIGGFVFQWADGWWKYKQEVNLSVHDPTASWATAGYPHDFVEGANNMNEEWFGICAIGKTDADGHFPLYPRAGYYVLRDAFKLDPYDPKTTADVIEEHFDDIEPYDYDVIYKRALGTERARILERVRLANLMMKFETFTTAGKGFADPNLGQDTQFGHLESFFITAEVQPVRRFNAELTLNILGNVPTNPINEIFYEARGQRGGGLTDDTGQSIDLSGLERLAFYRASFEWDEAWFNLKGYYRTGHYHWIDEGDFFNLYQEANYGHWVDTYNGQAPFGMVFEGKKGLEGLKVAGGPQLYWGANPAVIGKYTRDLGDHFRFTLMHQEDIVQQGSTNTSARVPEPKSRKSTLNLRIRGGGNTELKVGGIISGTNRIGREFVSAREGTGVTYANSGFQIVEDEIRPVDTLGAKARFSADWSPVKVYVQGGYKGLVADSGADQMPNVTGWSLRETGRGNQYNVLSGALLQAGDFQIAPNFMYQRPLEGPLPNINELYAPTSNTFYPGVGPRNVRESPFAVLENRETIGLELLLAYDPTPATWLWMWDNTRREDADFAASLDFVYKIQPTSRDSGIGFSAAGQPLIFGAAPPATNIWDLTGRMIMNLPEDVRVFATLYTGQTQGNAGGTDALDRTILRGGGDVRLTYEKFAFQGELKFNDFGPYDYHRDFSITFPTQIYADASYAVQTAAWLVDFYSRMGVSYRMRFLDEFSVPLAAGPQDGYVWEVRSYVHLGI